MSTQKTSSVCSTSSCRQYAPVALLAAIGIAISVAVFCAAYSWEQHSVRRQFTSLAEDRTHAINTLVDDAARLLHFVDNPFLVGPRADSPEFPNYLRSVTAVAKADISRHPAVRALIWMPRVSRDERAAYERAARTAFDPKFQLGEPKTGAKSGSGQSDEALFPTYLCIATTPNQDPPDKGVTHDPEEWKVMEQARDTGLIAASAPTKMSVASNDRVGYRLFLPLYHGYPKDVASRRQAIAGFLRVDLDIGESVTNALKSIPPVGIDVWVSDATDGKNVAICEHVSRLKSPVTGGDERGTPDALESTSTKEFFGRKLLFRCCATEAFWANHTIWQPWVLLCGGLVLTLTVAGYQLSLAYRASAIERTVATRMAAYCRDIEQQRKGKNP